MSYIKSSFVIATPLIAASLAALAQSPSYSRSHLLHLSEPVFKKDTFNILKYGAKADGIVLNTQSNKAINEDECTWFSEVWETSNISSMVQIILKNKDLWDADLSRFTKL